MQNPGLGQPGGFSQLLDIASGKTTVGDIASQQLASVSPEPWKIGAGGVLAVLLTGTLLGFSGYVGYVAARRLFRAAGF